MLNKKFIYIYILLSSLNAFSQEDNVISKKIKKEYHINKYDSISIKKFIVDEKSLYGMYFFAVYQSNDVLKSDFFIKMNKEVLFKKNDFNSVKIFRKNYKSAFEKVFSQTKIEEMDSILFFVIKPPKF